MTTKNSPAAYIKVQADTMAKMLKQIAAGKLPKGWDKSKVAAALLKDSIVVGIVMDDNVLKLTIPWTIIRTYTEEAISEWIAQQMKDERIQ